MSVFVPLFILICNFCCFYEYISFETRQIYNTYIDIYKEDMEAYKNKKGNSLLNSHVKILKSSFEQNTFLK